jgi:hypothetical protein
MPWVYRSRSAKRTRFKAKFKQWAFDHSSAVTEVEIGVVVIASFLLLILLMARLV